MCFSSPKTPSAPPPPPPPEAPIDAAGEQERNALRKRLRSMSGYASTSLTGGQGVTGTPNIGKTSLGA